LVPLTDTIQIRQTIRIHGIVQGVGFRPFIYRLATRFGLSGSVSNDSEGVLIEAEGSPDTVEAFVSEIKTSAPPQSLIQSIVIERTRTRGDTAFVIDRSEKCGAPDTMISPDIGTCTDCQTELFDVLDRRYGYPFINCTNCGPRYTILHQIPYDRPNTSMAAFDLCPACRREYENPENRRLHAQPNACPVCGPRLSLVENTGESIRVDDPVSALLNRIAQGQVAAIRGLGGFHLAVDPFNEQAVATLRNRKGRRDKPFALMADHARTIRKYCHVSADEEALLSSPARPIVLLEKQSECMIAPSVAPGQHCLGFMLPYTPLHHLLLERGGVLVMTSANRAEEPIAIGNEEALDRLSDVADVFLLHDREILQRCDDSVVRFIGDSMRPIRRSRGFVPAPVRLPVNSSSQLLATGGELKNTIALCRQDNVFLSQHIGDLDNTAAFRFFEDTIEHLSSILDISPDIIVCDLHPEYLSSKWARKRSEKVIEVQHHHAHLASVMAENGVTDTTIGIILDGTGYGTDGTIWGGEVLVGNLTSFYRYAHLDHLRLPGGETAIREPWRLALAALIREYGREATTMDLPVLREQTLSSREVIAQMMERGINSPKTSSAGRLFDTVAALVGVRSTISYEAQAAIELESVARCFDEEAYRLTDDDESDRKVLSTSSLIQSVVRDVLGGVEPGRISARFHRSVAELFLMVACRARTCYGVNRVGLSGGVFQNVLLFNLLTSLLSDNGFQILTHRKVPANDGGLAYGQAAVAAAIISKRGQ